MKKTYTHFSKTERQELFILKKKGYYQKDIAKVLNKSPSSISRELKRNQVNGEYIPDKANHKAYIRRKYSKTYSLKIVSNPKLREFIHTRTKSKYY
jgi:IS30 family transposase